MPMERAVFIYALKCPVTLEVRYVGKSNDPKARLRHHLDTRSRKSISHKNHWLNSLLANGRRPLLEILEVTTEADWPQREQYYIQLHRASGKLTNATGGGEGAPGCKQSPETVAKRVAKNTGKRRTPEQIATLRAAAAKRLFGPNWCSSLVALQTRVSKRVHRFDASGNHLDSYPSVAAMCRALLWPREQVTNSLGSRRGTGRYLQFQVRYATYTTTGIEEVPVCNPWVRPERVHRERTPEQRAKSSASAQTRSPVQLARAAQNSRRINRLMPSGQLVDCFDSVTAMCRETGFKSYAVYAVLNQYNKTHCGYTFQYAE
jgi:hypothetical protein